MIIVDMLFDCRYREFNHPRTDVKEQKLENDEVTVKIEAEEVL